MRYKQQIVAAMSKAMMNAVRAEAGFPPIADEPISQSDALRYRAMASAALGTVLKMLDNPSLKALQAEE